eukprot:6951220-Lingulodinium_polyedra.AAC.1
MRWVGEDDSVNAYSMETIRGMARRGFTPCNARPNTVEQWTPDSRNDFPPLDSYVKTEGAAK